MSAAVKPVTPLQPLPFSTGSIDKIISAADGETVAQVASIQDAAYLVHAANAYPKLVEALRIAAEQMGHGPYGMEARALLRELGEDA